MLSYRIQVEPDDNGTLLVTSPDLPEVTTFGLDEDDARKRAVSAIEEALAARIHDNRDVPSSALNGLRVDLPLTTALKVALYRVMRQNGVRRADLQRRLKWNRESVDRLFRLDHKSKLDQIEAAFAAMELKLEIRFIERSSLGGRLISSAKQARAMSGGKAKPGSYRVHHPPVAVRKRRVARSIMRKK